MGFVSLYSQDNKPEECSVCFNDYDDNQLRPRTLPCGHTFCSQCIDNAIKNGQLTCPSCRAEHAATAATQFPISYAVEAFVRKLKNIQLTTEEVVQAKPYEGPTRGISKTLRSLVQEQKSIISSLITSCEEEVGTTIDTADGCKMKVENWLKKCQELFPDVNTVHTSVKRSVTKENVRSKMAGKRASDVITTKAKLLHEV
nr:tripartite motif containing 13-like [Procambarus clarkii]